MKCLIAFIISIISISSCHDNEYIIFPDLNEDYRRILRLSENEFRTKIRSKFKFENDNQNLLEYLKSISIKGEQIFIPSEQLQLQLESGPIIRDIWNKDKSVNLEGEFVKCISQSKSRFLSEYYSRIQNVGDIAPSVIAEALIKHIELDRTDEYIFPIATINFYLTTLI